MATREDSINGTKGGKIKPKKYLERATEKVKKTEIRKETNKMKKLFNFFF